MEIFPAQTLSIEIVAVGYRYGTVKKFVSATLNNQSLVSILNNISRSNRAGRINELEKIQSVEKRCTLVNYIFFSPNMKEKLVANFAI